MSTTPYIAAHLRALGSTEFDLGVLLSTDTMIPRRNWTAAQVARALPWLRAQNFQGAQIFIRPSLDHINAILVDDIPTTQLSRVTLEPAAILETSPGNCQVWIRLTQTVSVPHARVLARHLQQLWNGDPGSADGQHFGRLAGFTNRWPRHQQSDGSYPLVRLLTTQRVLYEPAAICPWVPEPAAATPRRAQTSPLPLRRLRPLEEFWADPRYGGDYHRADLAWAMAALRAGWTSTMVAQHLESARDLSKKGSEPRQKAYVNRTVAKAQQIVQESA